MICPRLVSQFLTNRWHALIAALTIAPDRAGWGQCAAILVIFGVAEASLALVSSFVRGDPVVAPWWQKAGIAAALLIKPALLEELFFRVLLLPRPGTAASRTQIALWAGVSLVLFIAWHPLNGRLFRPAALPLFTGPVFLTLAGLLGAACTLAYFTTQSVWPGTLIHWLAVAIWILCLGGQGALGGL